MVPSKLAGRDDDTVTENRKRVNRGTEKGKRVRCAKRTVPEKWKNVT